MPLKSLLEQYKDKDFQLGLYQNNVYCFHSESFRYLAAHKQGVDMGRLEDYCRSWEQSVKESRRLMRHFRSLTPHQVKSTLSLNESRCIISQLTKPMAEIAQVIKSSIAVNEDRAKELEERKLDQGELEKKLFIEKVLLTAYPLEQPRTVCGNKDCVEMNDVNEHGKEVKKTVYKSFCHGPCHLQNVRPETVKIQTSTSVMHSKTGGLSVGSAGMCGKNTCISCTSYARN